jgi:hypothetical protein
MPQLKGKRLPQVHNLEESFLDILPHIASNFFKKNYDIPQNSSVEILWKN